MEENILPVTEMSRSMDCHPSNDQLIMIPGIFDHKPVSECSGDIFSTEFNTLKDWEKRSTPARQLFENAAFFSQDVEIKSGTLNLKASYIQHDNRGCISETGAQVEYTKQKFSPEDGYTYSIIMKPTGQPGVISAFFVHLIDANTNNADYCKNNNEIDLEVVRYGSEADPSLRGKLFAYFTSWTRALNPWNYRGDPCAQDPSAWDQRQRESHGVQLSDRFTKEFHKYSFTWKENEIDFYIDDQFMAKNTKVIPQKPCPLKINTWAGYSWLRYSKNKPFEAVTEVKQVSVSSRGIR